MTAVDFIVSGLSGMKAWFDLNLDKEPENDYYKSGSQLSEDAIELIQLLWMAIRFSEGEEERKEEEEEDVTGKISRPEALRKCIVVFEAMRRVSSKGNAGLEPEKGAEEEFQTDCGVLDALRGMLLEMESGNTPGRMADWQEVAKNGPPERMTF